MDIGLVVGLGGGWTMKIIALSLVLFVLIAIFSLPFVYFYLGTFLLIGGGWAYAGPADRHFVLNPFGYAMIIAPGLLACGAAAKLLKRDK